jgi:hypothetical protein
VITELAEFTNNWETAFDVTDTTFDCNVNRTKGDTSTQTYLINHFLDVLIFGQPAPDVNHANVTNGGDGVGALGTQVGLCAAVHGRNPNYLLVDVSFLLITAIYLLNWFCQFYEIGNGSVFQVASTANGVTYSPTIRIAQPVTASSTSTGASATGTNGAVSSSGCVCVLAIASALTASIILGGLGDL